MNYDKSTSCWKPCVRFELILTMRDIYINSNLNPITKFTSSNRSTEFRDILPWDISQMITETIPISMRIIISHTMKWGILFWVYWKVTGNWNNMVWISHGAKAIVEQILALEERKKSKRAMWVTVRDPSRKVNYISKVVWDRKTMTHFTRSTRIG